MFGKTKTLSIEKYSRLRVKSNHKELSENKTERNSQRYRKIKFKKENRQSLASIL